MTASPEQFYRVAFAKESSFKTAGAFTNAKGLLSPVTIAPSRERVKRDDAANSFGDSYADEHGRQQYTANLFYYMTANSYADLRPLLTAALGEEDAGGAITFTATTTNLGCTISAGTPSAIVRATADDGKFYFVPVDTKVGTAVTYGVSLGTGRTTTTIVNLSTLSGGVFDYALGSTAGGTLSADTFSIESDWATKPLSTDQEVILAKGAVITSAKLNYEKDKLLSFGFGFGMAAEYTEQSGPAVNVADPGVFTVPYLGWAGDWILAFPGTGTAAAYTVTGAHALGLKSVVLAVGTGTLNIGDLITFAGSTIQYVVTANLAAPGSVSIEPGLQVALVGGEAVSLVGTPRWTDAKLPLKKIDIEMCPEIIPETGSNGLDGGSLSTSVLPGSDVRGYTRSQGFMSDGTMLVPYDIRYRTIWKAKKIGKLFGVMYPGTPNATPIPVNRAAMYIRRLVPIGAPVVVMDGKVKCMQLSFKIERDLTANGIPERFHFALSN
jgi:hypothetical protein